jgi:predicted glycoside hydrolase/deacetylase ChbG (UPF0249 family)
MNRLKPIFICADDFGMNAEINAGILELAEAGRVSAASCMSRGKTFVQDARALSLLPIEKGLHLNLTESLSANEFVQPLPALIWQCFSRRIHADQVRKEIDLQLDAFESAFGQAPDYIDGHQHVHQFPVVRDCLIKAMLDRYPACMPWLRSTISPSWEVKPNVIECLGARSMKRLADRHGVKMNAHLLGVYGLRGGASRYAERLDAWMGQATSTDVVMCHPAHQSSHADALSAQRFAELSVLAGPTLARLLEQHQTFVSQRLFPAVKCATEPVPRR